MYLDSLWPDFENSRVVSFYRVADDFFSLLYRFYNYFRNEFSLICTCPLRLKTQCIKWKTTYLDRCHQVNQHVYLCCDVTSLWDLLSAIDFKKAASVAQERCLDRGANFSVSASVGLDHRRADENIWDNKTSEKIISEIKRKISQIIGVLLNKKNYGELQWK